MPGRRSPPLNQQRQGRGFHAYTVSVLVVPRLIAFVHYYLVLGPLCFNRMTMSIIFTNLNGSRQRFDMSPSPRFVLVPFGLTVNPASSSSSSSLSSTPCVSNHSVLAQNQCHKCHCNTQDVRVEVAPAKKSESSLSFW